MSSKGRPYQVDNRARDGNKRNEQHPHDPGDLVEGTRFLMFGQIDKRPYPENDREQDGVDLNDKAYELWIHLEHTFGESKVPL